MTSWKTTLSGLLMALGAFFLTQDFAFAEILAAVLNGGGAFLLGSFARDSDVSSEQAGAVVVDVE